MLSQYIRVFTKTGSSDLVDVSLDNQDGEGLKPKGKTIYVGQSFPFVNLYFQMQTVNNQTVTGLIEVDTPYDPAPIDEIQKLTLSRLPVSGSFKLSYGGNKSPLIFFNDSLATIQTKLRTITGLENATVTGGLSSGFLITLVGVASPSLIEFTDSNLLCALSKFKIEYWDGVAWRLFVDIMDSSKGLNRSSMVQYSLDNHYAWNRVPRTNESYSPDELKSINVDDCYWMRFSFEDGDLSDDVVINRICYAFTTTSYVNDIDKEAPRFYESLGDTSKNNWEDEIILSSEMMVNDLKAMRYIKHQGQIIRFDELYLACAYRTLAHIYFNLGKAYLEKREAAMSEYSNCLSSRGLTFDSDADGEIEEKDLNETQTGAYR